MAGTYSKEWRVTREDGTVATRSNTWSPPGSHPVGYGVKVITDGGRLIRIEGDDDNPITQGRVNALNLALREYTYSPDRVIYPMKRAYEDRGKMKWERTTWDEALDTICEKVRYYQTTYGPESIVCFGGTGREACIFYYALTFSVLQSPNCCYTQSGWSCYGPRCSIADYVLGAGYPELDYAGHLPGRFEDPAYKPSKWVVVWGKEPLPSNGDGFFGHVLVDMMKLGTHLISVDPRITWPGSRNGNINVQLRPQTDTCFALGVMNLMFQNDEYDHDFVEQWIYGLDELRGVSIDEEENIRIGSLSSFSHITRDPIIQKYINVLGEAVDMVGGPQIRNIGTIGGNTRHGGARAAHVHASRVGGHRGADGEGRHPPPAHQRLLHQGRSGRHPRGGWRDPDRHPHPKGELRKLLWLLHQVRHEKRDGHRDARVQRERAPVARQADY